jgi:hypothetical protein
MSHDEEKQGGVKVVDRRRLDDAGSERPDAPPAPGPVAAKASGDEPAPHVHGPGCNHDHDHDADGPDLAFPIDFATFIQSLAQQALMHLGLIPYPDTGEHMRELPLARQTIDILQVLHDKTKGNLTPDEKQLFDAILHDLRLVYVQIAEGKPAPK